jgi:hypothetical protein
MNEKSTSEKATEILKKTHKVFSTEDIVIITVIALGLLGSVIIFLCNASVPPIVISILLGTGISALVYRFLGGITVDTSFAIGALKLSGTMAALVGCAYFINTELEKQTMHNMDRLFDPHVSRWFALEKSTGVPLEVNVAGVGDIDIPEKAALEAIPLSVRKKDESLLVVPRKESKLPLGSLNKKELKNAGFTISIGSSLDKFVVTDRLPPSTQRYSLNPLPFRINTGAYSQDYSHFELTNSNGESLYSGSIYRKQAKIISIDNKYYVIAVVEVNHLPIDGHPYAKFAIGELMAGIE